MRRTERAARTCSPGARRARSMRGARSACLLPADSSLSAQPGGRHAQRLRNRHHTATEGRQPSVYSAARDATDAAARTYVL